MSTSSIILVISQSKSLTHLENHLQCSPLWRCELYANLCRWRITQAVPTCGPLKNKVLKLTRQPAFPSCHHLLYISSPLLFLAQCSVEKTDIKQVVTWEMRAALCVGPGIRPPGLLAWGESNTWHLSPHIPFTTSPTPSPCMGDFKKAFTYSADKNTGSASAKW